MTAETDTPQAAGSCCSSTGSCHDGAADVQVGGVTAVYEVKGMTCGHCEGAVSEEISGIAGVTSVKAEAATGRVTVASAAPLSDDAVREAVDEAGYELVGRA
ncbi:heavy-metal-associated domain-containing protein [Streptomyces sp. NE06-03E]|uniref:Copper chaperone n=2 Tax=Streptomyces TaxID=1883 RepID=A0A652KKG8_9ACTN|nr:MULTISPECIES: heavy-metal-associated domain-containing protein [unclassified Streptomyces]WSS68962.1 heavy-metal-associated domain-containing protein [Streptomyces sp. NBC_01175]WSS75973.1 heavy-metal-associated domain-containing protein [Streptomyces sp. NBC_01174]MDX3058766.1 heavy-metal-associated domain-containing protein [Streptomyces sp. NE06-03E]MDX3324976.1 heavy-metal-associated domain-containing protein [Streptomyces sp. ME02-6979-3A]MDX3428797.1 heavy-metal-associated domain-cont